MKKKTKLMTYLEIYGKQTLEFERMKQSNVHNVYDDDQQELKKSRVN